MRDPADPVGGEAARVAASDQAGSVSPGLGAGAVVRIQAQLDGWSAQPWAYDYFAAMRRLESLAAPAPRWGRALLPGAEPLRVGQEPSMSFAPASFSRFEAPNARSPQPRLRQHFFGYLGPNGPLPVHLSEFIRERSMNHGDPTWLAFLDSFAHRFSLHFYRAWAQARPAVGLDRPGEDGFRRQIGALVGIGTEARQSRDEVHDDARLHFAGRLARRVHNAEGVEAVIGRYFDVPARLEPWVGHWMALPSQELSRLGRGEPASITLGGGAMLGRRAWDRQHRVRLHLGPLPLARYREFLPIGSARPALQRWMQQLLGDELYWDAELVLDQRQVPPTRLGHATAAPRGSATAARPGSATAARPGNAPRLGWTSWLGSLPRTRDATDVRIRGDDTQRRAYADGDARDGLGDAVGAAPSSNPARADRAPVPMEITP